MRLNGTDDVLALIAGDAWMMQALAALRTLDLPDAWIGAGFVRAKVWDTLHGRTGTPALDDVDVIYFDPADLTKTRERALQRRLVALMPDAPWSAKNQARMHLKNGDPPYRSTAHAMTYWLETPTCVAVRLADTGHLELLAPYGMDDLLALVLRPTPAGRRRAQAYAERLQAKDWLARWPRVRPLLPDGGCAAAPAGRLDGTGATD